MELWLKAEKMQETGLSEAPFFTSGREFYSVLIYGGAVHLVPRMYNPSSLASSVFPGKLRHVIPTVQASSSYSGWQIVSSLNSLLSWGRNWLMKQKGWHWLIKRHLQLLSATGMQDWL